MSKSTAMTKLIKELEEFKKDFDNNSSVSNISLTIIDIAIAKAKRLMVEEREQILYTYNEGMDHFVDAEDYPNLARYFYEEKFGKVNN